MKRFNYLFILIILVGLACTESEKKAKDQTQLKEEPARIYFEIDAEDFESIESGDEIRMDLMESGSYTIKIRRVEETMPGIVSISAFLNDEKTGQATLIFREGKLSGQVTINEEGKMYTLGFDEEEDLHFLFPVDPENRDVLRGDEPKEVPRGEG